MGGRDLAVEVLLEQVGRARAHGRASIETAVRRFNARAALALVLLAAPVAAVEIPGTAGHLTAGGYVDGLAVAETEGGKRERPQAFLDLRLDGTATRSLRGHLELRERFGGPFEGGPGAGVYDWSHVYQNRSPSTEVIEAFADVHLRRADLRVGVQKVAWGKLDGIPPTDLVNPRDYHDPLIEDFEERKIGIPAVNATYYLPDVARLALTGLRATLVWVPIAVPPRLALLDERWFPSSIRPPAHVVVSRSALARAGLPSATALVLPVMLRTENHRPPRRLDAGGLALRLGGTVAESDWDLYHYTGPETGPDLDLRPELQLLSLRPLAARVVSRLRQAHDTIHMTGVDWAMPLGGFTVRAEAAWLDDRPYLRRSSDLASPAALARLPLRKITIDLLKRHRAAVPLGALFPSFDTVEWGAGADYFWHGYQPLLQVNQVAFLGRTPPLVLSDPETRVVASLHKRYLGERMEAEVRGVWAFERQAWFVFPRLSYRVRDDLRLRVGYLAIGGPRLSLIGQFRNNDEFVLDARYSF